MLDRAQVRSSLARRLGLDVGALVPGRPRRGRRGRNDAGCHPALRRPGDAGAAVRLVRLTVPDRAQRPDPAPHGRLARRQRRADAGRFGRDRARTGPFPGPRRRPIGPRDDHLPGLAQRRRAARSGAEGRAGAPLVRHDPSLRRRQRPHRPRTRRPGPGPLGGHAAAVLQPVGPDPPGAQRLLRHSGKHTVGHARRDALAGLVPGLPGTRPDRGGSHSGGSPPTCRILADSRPISPQRPPAACASPPSGRLRGETDVLQVGQARPLLPGHGPAGHPGPDGARYPLPRSAGGRSASYSLP